MSSREEGPVYYREIQKHAYLTRITNEVSGGKLRPLGSKKVPNKPMWTQFCVHNGRTPYLEQYPGEDSGAALAHKPVWRACLRGARHVTASVKPQHGDQYDFLIDTDNGAVRMLAPDWESMQEWVSTLRNTLHELKIVSRGENVYCAGPAPPPPAPPRAAARDPTSPLPPTPPTPPDRVPGIELTPNIRTAPSETTTRPQESTSRQETTSQPQETTNVEPEIDQTCEDENIDISNWEPFASLPSTSQSAKPEPNKSVAKICGQNICLDDSIFKRTCDGTDSDDEFFADKGPTIDFESGFKQRLVVSDEKTETANEDSLRNQATNITVIQVSNKEPPHTAIPILGPETDVFDFDFKQNLTINDTADPSFINIVNTEHNEYGTTFSKESDYGHLSLTTTVSLNGPTTPTNEELYERLCLASTSNVKPSPMAVKKVKSVDKNRKSSLPNLDVSESTYEYLFLSNNNSNLTNSRFNSGTLTNNSSSLANAANSRNLNSLGGNQSTLVNLSNDFGGANNTSLSNSPSLSNPSNLPKNSSNLVNNSRNTSNNTSNLANSSRNLPNNSNNFSNNSSNLSNNSNNLSNNSSNLANEVNSNGDSHRVQISSTSIDPISRVRSVERSRSQNAYDASPRAREREHLIRRVQDNSPKRDAKNDKDQPQPKPIWRRGLTELSILTRIRSLGQTRRQESPTRPDTDNNDRSQTVTSPVKVFHRSRPEARVDPSRRRSNSLSNGGPPLPAAPPPPLQPLRARQAAELVAEQRRGAALVAEVPARLPPPVFADYNKQVWVSRWGGGGARWGGRAGDRVCAVRGVPPKDAAHAAQLLQAARGPLVDILFHRVPLGNIYVINKREQDSLGIKLDGECNISGVAPQSAAGRAGLPPPGRWAVTEVNNRPLNILKGGEEDMNRLSMHGSEVSILIQPSPLVKKLRAALKANRTLLGLR